MSENYPLELSSLEKSLGYTFNDIGYLETATTHSSYSNELRARGIDMPYNERMEFLGDSVLSIVTSRYLFTTHPDMPEGELSRVRSQLVCEKAIGRFARDISLGSYMKLGRGEENTNGRDRISILADAFEATLAAVYLDGGIEPVRDFLLPILERETAALLEGGCTRDFKTMLQQLIQQERGELLEYVTVSESGPMHMRRFEVEARLNNNVIGRGRASSKREAEQCAAKEALALFGETV